MPRKKPLIGIALGSGIGRGWAHIGVLNRLEAAGLRPDIVCGTSIGALIGGSYVGGHMQELEAWARALTKSRVAGLFDFQLGMGGLIAGRRITQSLHPDLHRLVIEELDRPFVAVATDLSNGHEVWIQEGLLIDAMRASYAIPGLFPPTNQAGRWLVDGALVNPVPVSVCRALGAHITIAVNLNADPIEELPFREECSDLASDETGDSPEPRSAAKGVIRSFFRHRQAQPSVLTVMSRSLAVGQDRIARSRLAGDPPDVMISPRLGGIGMFEFFRAEDSIEAGAAAAEKVIPEIQAFLQRYPSSATQLNGVPSMDGTTAAEPDHASKSDPEMAA